MGPSVLVASPPYCPLELITGSTRKYWGLKCGDYNIKVVSNEHIHINRVAFYK